MISRHREGQESNESDPCQGKLQKDLDFAHISMYAVLLVKPVYVRAYKFKVMCIIFHMFLGMIKETSKDKKWSTGSQESAAGQGKAIIRGHLGSKIGLIRKHANNKFFELEFKNQ